MLRPYGSTEPDNGLEFSVLPSAAVLMDPIRSSVYNVCASSPVVASHTTKYYNKNTDCKYTTDSSKLLRLKKSKYHSRLDNQTDHYRRALYTTYHLVFFFQLYMYESTYM